MTLIGWMIAAAATASDGPEVLELPFVRADRAAREVRVVARATGIEAKTLCEFFLIATNSGHDYEAIAVSLARPGDIHRALEHIGLPAGRPVDPKQLRFWPRGERVIAEFEWCASTNPASPPRRVRFEDTLLDTRMGRPLPADGLVFVGSARVPAADGTGTVYAADEVEPNSIASAFNLETTVLDIPRRGSQSALYDYQVVNPDHVWTAGAPLTVVLRPEPRPTGEPRVADFNLTAATTHNGSPVFRLVRAPGQAQEAEGGAEAILAAIEAIARAGRDAHLTIVVAPRTSVSALRPIGEALGRIAEHPAVRIEPPPAGQLYYRALAPDPSLRNRAERPSQPWEIRFEIGEGSRAAVLIKVEPTRDLITDAPTYHETRRRAGSPTALRAALDEWGPGLPVLVVFAPPAMTFGELLEWIAPLQTTHPVVHVFAD